MCYDEVTMSFWRFLGYLLINVVVTAVVAAVVMFGVLWWWEQNRVPGLAVEPPTPTALNPGVAPASPTPPTPYATPTPTLHLVQAGQTLGSIALQYGVTVEAILQANGLTDPNRINAGQVLVIPVAVPPTPTVPPSPTVPPPTRPPLPTPTRDPNQPAPTVTIREVLSPGVLAEERVVIANSGGPVDLNGWTLRDDAGRAYTFPALTLFSGGAVNVHTQAGLNTVVDLYWGQPAPVWGSGSVLTLADAAGNLVARFVVP